MLATATGANGMAGLVAVFMLVSVPNVGLVVWRLRGGGS